MAYQAPLPAGSTPSYWQNEATKLQAHVAPKSLDQLPDASDIVIIGGGYAGVAIAYHLLKSDAPPKSVLLLEARQICSGATGRNGGHLRPDLLMAPSNLQERVNSEAATELMQFELGHIQAIRDLVKEEGIECDLVEATNLTVLTTPAQVDRIKSKYEKLRNDPLIDQEVLDQVELYVGDDAPRRTGVIGAKGYFAMPAGRLSAYKLLMGLFTRCLDLGLQYKSHTPIKKFEKGESGDWILTTESGAQVKAGKIVFATNAYTSALLPEYSKAIIPCKGFACRITAPEGKKLPELPSSSMVMMEVNPKTQDTGYNYMIQLNDTSIVIGGAHHMYGDEDLEGWYQNTDDSKPILGAKKLFEEDYMQKTFLGWEETGARLNYGWTGIMGYSADSRPHIGLVPGEENAFILAGFNGHGMPLIFQSAKGVSDMITQDIGYEQSKLPRTFKTTVERLGSTTDDILAGRGIKTQTTSS